MKYIFFFISVNIFLLFTSHVIVAQDSYFQQEVNYTIKVKLDDNKHELSAFVSIEYSNNSPDTLKYIMFHLWPNAYKNRETAFAIQELENGSSDFYFADENERGFIDSLNFNVDGKPCELSLTEKFIDIGRLELNKPLIPGGNITISTPFRVKIPGDFSRLGHVKQSYQISQWYPKPAVYDQEGWHAMPYLNMGEFYSEYGSFDVEISLPKNYVVGATGELQSPAEIKWLNLKAVDTIVNKQLEGSVTEIPESEKEFKTIRYTEKNVHDFAWFADKRYGVLKDSVQLPNSKKWVTTWAMFLNNEYYLWKKATEYINDAIYYYSKWYGDYPYVNCTAVRGSITAGGAMEYPTITVVGNADTELMLESMIMHEVGHNWFYGVLGFNERDFPYLDEGINSFSEFRYLNDKYDKGKKLQEIFFSNKSLKILNINDTPFSAYYELSSLLPQRFNVDQAMNRKSVDLTMLNYGSTVYHKSALAYYYLLHSIGEENFNKTMQAFYDKWKFKHPQPQDLQNAFEEFNDSDLLWFFEDLIGTTKKVDYKILRKKDDKVLLKNIGQINSPVSISGFINNEANYTVWNQGFTGEKWLELPNKKADRIILNAGEIPEFNKKNNTLKTSGIFKRIEPIEISLLQIIEKTNKTQLGVLPAAGWNNYNGYMLGAMFYSPALPMKLLEYQLIPMYGFKNKNFAGLGRITLHTYPFRNIFERVDFGLSARQFAFNSYEKTNYHKFKGELNALIRKSHERSFYNQQVNISYMSASNMEDIIEGNNDIGNVSITNISYLLSNKNLLQPYNLKLSVEGSSLSVKTEGEFNYSLTTNYSKKALRIRVFGGYFFDSPEYSQYEFTVGGTSGINDYKYDDLYFGRFEQFGADGHSQLLSQQFAQKQGGFASASPLSTDKWLVALNAKVKIPKTPINFYMGVASYDKAGKNENTLPNSELITTKLFAYELGFNLEIGSVLNVYFPIAVSSDIAEYQNLFTNNYSEKIRFSLNLNNLNVFDMREMFK